MPTGAGKVGLGSFDQASPACAGRGGIEISKIKCVGVHTRPRLFLLIGLLLVRGGNKPRGLLGANLGRADYPIFSEEKEENL